MVATLIAAILVLPSISAAGAATPGGFRATALSPDTTVTAAKSKSGRLATSDPALLGRTDATPVNVVVKLDYDAAASYKGDVAGLAATSPSVTGRELDRHSPRPSRPTRPTPPASRRASGPAGGRRCRRPRPAPPAAGVRRRRRAPAGQPGRRCSPCPAWSRSRRTRCTSRRPIEPRVHRRARRIWNQSSAARRNAGKGVIFGALDTGVWPEHPSFADNPATSARRRPRRRHARACNFGDNPLTPAIDVFACNNKLIGGQPFLDTYNAVSRRRGLPDSARDSDGHGTHTVIDRRRRPGRQRARSSASSAARSAASRPARG